MFIMIYLWSNRTQPECRLINWIDLIEYRYNIAMPKRTHTLFLCHKKKYANSIKWYMCEDGTKYSCMKNFLLSIGSGSNLSFKFVTCKWCTDRNVMHVIHEDDVCVLEQMWHIKIHSDRCNTSTMQRLSNIHICFSVFIEN